MIGGFGSACRQRLIDAAHSVGLGAKEVPACLVHLYLVAGALDGEAGGLHHGYGKHAHHRDDDEDGSERRAAFAVERGGERCAASRS
jgi:hypothetical protein